MIQLLAKILVKPLGLCLRPLRRVMHQFWRAETGTATIEFVIVFPVFITIFVSAFEAGLLKTRHVMLERSVDLAVRQLRLGTWVPPTHQELKQEICDHANIIPDCMNVMLLELRPVSTQTWSPLAEATSCVDRAEEIAPVTDFDGGQQNEMMLVRVCVIVDPFFPYTGLGLTLPEHDQTGGYALVSTSAFVNEPN